MKVKSQQNLIASRLHHNTYSYRVASTSNQQFFSYWSDTNTRADNTKTTACFATSLARTLTNCNELNPECISHTYSSNMKCRRLPLFTQDV